MRIRDLRWKGISMWPPEWWVSDEGAGEKGFLKKVQFRKEQTPACLSIVASHLGEERNGVIILEDLLHLETLCQKLKENIGRPLFEIGNLDIDFSFSFLKKGPKQVRPQITQAPETFPLVAVKLKR
jgi:hypothetical protein